MNEKRKYPLFVIDYSRSHGRGGETDYICCTGKEMPFVASATLHQDKEYAELYDPNEITEVWSEPRQGIRMRIKVISELPNEYKDSDLTSLLRRALKEVMKRYEIHRVNLENVTDKDVVEWCEVLIKQVYENLRENPFDKIQKMNKEILTKIINDYKSGN